jgi:hypothetical protein
MSILNKTEQMLVEKHGALLLTMPQLAQEMQITVKSLHNMLSAERCPVETIGHGKLRRAPIVNVAKWMNGK